MTRYIPVTGHDLYLGVSRHSCPLCAGQLQRTRRRFVDRVTSLFAPARRYRCQRFNCQWEGNFHTHGSTTADIAASRKAHAAGVSMARKNGFFKASMLWVVVGLVGVLVATTTDWLPGVATAGSDVTKETYSAAAPLDNRIQVATPTPGATTGASATRRGAGLR